MKRLGCITFLMTIMVILMIMAAMKDGDDDDEKKEFRGKKFEKVWIPALLTDDREPNIGLMYNNNTDDLIEETDTYKRYPIITGPKEKAITIKMDNNGIIYDIPYSNRVLDAYKDEQLTIVIYKQENEIIPLLDSN